MNTKHILILLFILIASIVVTGCNEVLSLPTATALENKIKETISSKGDDYDFLNDEEYIDLMHRLANLFIERDIIKEEHYAIGHLNDDMIPELVVFRERDPNNVEDKGNLEVYGFLEEKYSLIDRVSMNYDNTNYELVIGKIGPDQNGILLNNQAGSKSGITYGFKIDELRLVSVLNDDKINLVSINTDNEIKDIDNDGILEFSVYTIDPESIDQSLENSDKIKYWYKWDGSDGGELVEYEKIINKNSPQATESNKEVLEEVESLILSDRPNFIEYLKNNKDDLSIEDTTTLINDYTNALLVESKAKNMVIRNLFSKYQIKSDSNHLFEKYGLSLERLNDPAYLKREKVLNSEVELKDHLIRHLELGYIITEDNDGYTYSVNYKLFLDSFGENILKEYRDYFKILDITSSEPYMKNDSLMISLDSLANRIILIDNFRITYPYSEFIDKLDPIYNDYLNALLYGSSNSPVFDEENNLIKEDILNEYRDIEENYANTNLGSIVSDYIMDLKINKNKINSEIQDKFSSALR